MIDGRCWGTVNIKDLIDVRGTVIKYSLVDRCKMLEVQWIVRC